MVKESNAVWAHFTLVPGKERRQPECWKDKYEGELHGDNVANASVCDYHFSDNLTQN